MSLRDDFLKSYLGPPESMSASIGHAITMENSVNIGGEIDRWKPTACSLDSGELRVWHADSDFCNGAVYLLKENKVNMEQRPYLYRAAVVDSRDHQIIPVEEFVAAGDDTARIIAWSMAAAKESLDVGVLEFYDIVLQRLGQVRPKRDAED